jgi:DNA-directed RNA polymerase specialized sigma24 family protein
MSRTMEDISMSISQSVWQQAQYDFLEDFLSFWLPPPESLAIDSNYPRSASMERLIKGRSGSLYVPEKSLLLLDKLSDEYATKRSERVFADWGTLFEFELLNGFGRNFPCSVEGAVFDGLRGLATTWGSYLAEGTKRSIFRWEVFSALGVWVADIWVELFRQLPSKDLGDAIRESVTPRYLRAGETVRYSLALFDGNQYELRHALDILEASDADLNREIKDMLHGHSSQELGRELKQKVIQMATFLKDAFGNDQFATEFQAGLRASLGFISWFIGYRLRQNLQRDQQRVSRLLEAISRHEEITAAMEQYRCKYSWGGDENKATGLAWQALAPKYFHLPRNVMDIHDDEAEVKLLGMTQGLKDYTRKHPAIDALADGFLGKLGAYLRRAGENEEKDYLDSQRSDGNRILTEAEHVRDLCYQDEEQDEELSDDEILSRAKEKYHPSGDVVSKELESKKTIAEWYNSLTENEKTVTNLKSVGYTEVEIATTMGISQQRVSQLVQGAWRKWVKIKNSSRSP